MSTDLSTDLLLWASLIVQFLLTVLGAVVALHEDWAKKHRVSVLSAFLAFGLIGMVVSARQAANSARDSFKLSEALQSLSRSTTEIGRVTSLNTQLQGRLLKQSDSLTDLAKKEIASATGGNSFCYINLSSRQNNNGDIALVCEGPFPVYELQVRAVDVGSLNELKATGREWSFQEMQSMTTYFDIGNMAPDSARMPGLRLPMRNDRHVQYNIFFSARNGFWTELLRLSKVNGEWKQARRVELTYGKDLKHDRHRLPWVQIDADFPKGEIDWQ